MRLRSALTLPVLFLTILPAAAQDRPRLELSRLTTAPSVDGQLNDEAWQGPPLALTEWLTYNPTNGDHIPQTTEVRAGYDERYLYFSFHCLDPEPGRVRSNLSRRDNLWNDDWVGFSLDSVGNGQSSYDMFINPAGVQGDILNTASGGENTAPDWVWDSAGRLTPEGYDVEVRLPLTSIRFQSGTEVKMGVMFWRRISRLGTSVSWPEIPAGKRILEQHATLILHDLKRPLTLEVTPSATYSRRETRTTPDGFGPADDDPDAGLSVKYGLTSSATVEGTINPDFSQVESDAFQVEVNQRFPIFFSEKRPFFMEGMGTFELAGVGGDAVMKTAVHTRKIVDPMWGGKATGTAGKVGFAMLAAGDDAPGRQIPGEPVNPFLDQRQQFLIARGQYSLGPSSYIGGIVTDSEFGSGHNRVVGTDVSLRKGGHSGSATFLATDSRTPDGTDASDGLGGQATYAFENKRIVFITQGEHYDRGFQMDTAFMNQVGITQGWTFVAPSFYPDAKKHPWFKRIVPFAFARYGNDRIQGGKPWIVVPGVRMHFTRQGFFRMDAVLGDEAWAGRTFRISEYRTWGEAQFTNWLYAFAWYSFGNSVFYDPVNPYLGRQHTYQAQLGLQPSSRFNQSLSYNRVEFDKPTGEREYAVDILNTKTTFQLNRELSLRLIVQYDSSAHRVLTDFLASWELIPGTVAYAGYGSLIERQGWDGQQFVPGTGNYQTSQRGMFFKVSYLHRF
jgi:uncharacterized protein DUF5916/cellulose/xylan binding protein with CBM9 domain